MSKTSDKLDTLEVNTVADLKKMEQLLSRELREQAGQDPLIAKLSTQAGDLMDGTTAEAVKRLGDK